MTDRVVDRRAFLGTLGRWTGGTCLACGLGGLGGWDGPAWAGSPPNFVREVEFYDKLPDKKIQCWVCPQHCILQDGETCFCRTRTNVGGTLYTRSYNNPAVLRVDPIEKMPLNHFRPGTKTLAIACGGCNVRCLYCQNWQISQKMPDELETFELTPAQAVEQARKQGLDTIAFNYTGVVASMEYAKDVAIAARKAELRVVAATAAFVEPGPLLDFAQHVDAFVVGLKGFDEEFYYRALGIKLAPVLVALEALKKRSKCWIEIVNLIVPTYNDDPAKIREMCRWIRDHLGADVPLHFARFVPIYKLTNLPRTSVPTLESACESARKAGLNYVYTSNIAPHPGTNTYCGKCGAALVQRLGFKILENNLVKGACPKCHRQLAGVWT